MTRYLVRFRRNNKERYWEHETLDGLYNFKELILKIFDETKEQKLEIVIYKNPNQEAAKGGVGGAAIPVSKAVNRPTPPRKSLKEVREESAEAGHFIYD